MSRKFIASVLAASLAVTSFSAIPARADGDDLVKFLAGATALVIIGNALDDNKSSRREASRRDNDRYDRGHGHRHDDGRRGGGYRREAGHGHSVGNGRTFRHDDVYPNGYGRDPGPKVYFDRRHDPRATRDADKRWRRNVLPAQCKTRFWTPEGTRKFMDRRCLKRNYSYADGLPKQCKITVYDKNQKKRGYSISCLKQKGYRIAQR